MNTLQEALFKAMAEIKALKAENGCLRQELDELREDQVMEELEKTKDLLKKETKRRLVRTYAYMDSLAENAKLVYELKAKEAERRQQLEGAGETMRLMLQEKETMWPTKVQELHRENTLREESHLKKEEQWKLQGKCTEEKLKVLSEQALSLQTLTSKPQNQNQEAAEAPREFGEEKKKKKKEKVEMWRDENEEKDKKNVAKLLLCEANT